MEGLPQAHDDSQKQEGHGRLHEKDGGTRGDGDKARGDEASLAAVLVPDEAGREGVEPVGHEVQTQGDPDKGEDPNRNAKDENLGEEQLL